MSRHGGRSTGAAAALANHTGKVGSVGGRIIKDVVKMAGLAGQICITR